MLETSDRTSGPTFYATIALKLFVFMATITILWIGKPVSALIGTEVHATPGEQNTGFISKFKGFFSKAVKKN